MNKANTISTFFTILTLLTAFGCERKDAGVIKREGQPDFVQDFDEARMDAAIAEAKSKIGAFISALEKQGPDSEGFAVKKAYTYGTDGKEFLWITEVKLTEGAFEGEVNNEPVNNIGVRTGQKVRVAPDEVADWMFMSRGSLQGGFTLVALVYGTDEEAEYQKKMGIDWAVYDFLKSKK